MNILVTAEQCLHRDKAFLAPCTSPPARGLGCTCGLEDTQLGQLALTDQKDNPYGVMLSV